MSTIYDIFKEFSSNFVYPFYVTASVFKDTFKSIGNFLRGLLEKLDDSSLKLFIEKTLFAFKNIEKMISSLSKKLINHLKLSTLVKSSIKLYKEPMSKKYRSILNLIDLFVSLAIDTIETVIPQYAPVFIAARLILATIIWRLKDIHIRDKIHFGNLEELDFDTFIEARSQKARVLLEQNMTVEDLLDRKFDPISILKTNMLSETDRESLLHGETIARIYEELEELEARNLFAELPFDPNEEEPEDIDEVRNMFAELPLYHDDEKTKYLNDYKKQLDEYNTKKAKRRAYRRTRQIFDSIKSLLEISALLLINSPYVIVPIVLIGIVLLAKQFYIWKTSGNPFVKMCKKINELKGQWFGENVSKEKKSLAALSIFVGVTAVAVSGYSAIYSQSDEKKL